MYTDQKPELGATSMIKTALTTATATAILEWKMSSFSVLYRDFILVCWYLVSSFGMLDLDSSRLHSCSV